MKLRYKIAYLATIALLPILKIFGIVKWSVFMVALPFTASIIIGILTLIWFFYIKNGTIK